MLPIWRDNWLFLLLDEKNGRERDMWEREMKPQTFTYKRYKGAKGISSLSHCDSDNPALPPETDESKIPPGKGKKGIKMKLSTCQSGNPKRLSEKEAVVRLKTKVFIEEHLAQPGLAKEGLLRNRPGSRVGKESRRSPYLSQTLLRNLEGKPSL